MKPIEATPGNNLIGGKANVTNKLQKNPWSLVSIAGSGLSEIGENPNDNSNF